MSHVIYKLAVAVSAAIFIGFVISVVNVIRKRID
jgi:hypothetical protein